MAQRTDGVQQCEDDGGRGPCAALAYCDPRVGASCYTIDSDGEMNISYRSCVISKGTWDVDHAFDSSCSTPLVLAFHGEAVSFTHPAGNFDLVGGGASFDHDWVSSATPWLALDDDGDGKITARDAVWPRLVVWSDTNQDRRSSASELTAVASRGLVAIDLSYESEHRCTGTACEVERARFEWKGGTGAVIDVHFATR